MQSDVKIVEECYWFEVRKLTQGKVDPTREWTFRLYNGSDGFGSTPLASDGTLGDADGILDFDFVNLDPAITYTVCEDLFFAGDPDCNIFSDALKRVNDFPQSAD